MQCHLDAGAMLYHLGRIEDARRMYRHTMHAFRRDAETHTQVQHLFGHPSLTLLQAVAMYVSMLKVLAARATKPPQSDARTAFVSDSVADD